MFGLGYVLLCLLIAVCANGIAPDPTRHANFQVLSLAKQPPGTRVHLLLLPVDTSASWRARNWVGGTSPQFKGIALQDTSNLSASSTHLRYTLINHRRDSVKLSVFTSTPKASSWKAYLTSRTYWFGTDTYGRDVLSRLMLGARVSLSIGLLAVTISLLVGIVMGLLAGYWGGWLDRLIMWFTSVVWSIPALLLALALSFVLGKGFGQLFLAIGLAMWVEVARVVRGQILSLREQPFTTAARMLGVKDVRIMWRHILPNLLSPLIVIAVANFGAAVLIESGLSFLGMGVGPPVPTWGQMINEGYTNIIFEHGRWLAFYPGAALILLIISINLIGIGLRDAFDVNM